MLMFLKKILQKYLNNLLKEKIMYKFYRFDHIERTTNNHIITAFNNRYNSNSIKCIMMEKLLGRSFQVSIFPNNEILYGTRDKYLLNDEPYHNYQTIINSNMFNLIKQHSTATNTIYILYGVLIGNSINRKVKYGRNTLMIHDVFENNNFMPAKKLIQFLHEINLKMAPIFNYNISLTNALKYNIEKLNTSVISVKHNPIYGCVIKPYNSELYLGKKRLILKKKQSKFNSKQVQDDITPPPKNCPIVSYWRHNNSKFIIEDRIHKIFNKYGIIKKTSDIQRYINLYIEDVRFDFNKQYPKYNVTRGQDIEIFDYTAKLTSWLIKFIK